MQVQTEIPLTAAKPPARLRRGAGAALVLNIVGAGALYLAQVLLARWMGSAQEYGKYALAFSLAQMLAFVAGLGLPMAALRFVPQYLEHNDLARLRGLVRSSWMICFGVGIVIAAGGSALTIALIAPQLQTALLLGLWMAPLMAIVNFQKEAARGAMRITLSLAPSQVLHPALLMGGALAVYGFYGGLSSTQALALLGATGIVVLAIQWFGLHRVLPRQRRTPAVYDMRLWLAVAVPLFFVQESLVILRQTDVVMIGYFSDTAEVGRYSAASRTAMLARFALTALSTIAAPAVAMLHARGDHAGLQRMVLTATRWMFWPSAFLTVGVCAFAKPALAIFGAGFEGAAATLWILALGQFIGAIFGPVGYLLNLTGHHNKSLAVYGGTAAMNIVLNAVMIPLWGIEGAAISTTASLAIRNVWAYVLVKKHLNIHSFAFFGKNGAGSGTP